MKHRFLIANWKSNKTVHETKTWFREFHAATVDRVDWSKLSIVVCVPFPLLPIAGQCIADHGLTVELGAQDISRFPGGSYTGEVNGRQIADLARFVIIGHTERRKYFGERDDVLAEKVARAREFALHSVYCVNSTGHEIPDDAEIVSYEPDWAIGTGTPEDPKDVEFIAETLKYHTKGKPVLYGGSVDADNVASFAQSPTIDGFLVGSASLDPAAFAEIARQLSVSHHTS